MPFAKLLDVSTAHLRKQDREALERLSDSHRQGEQTTPYVYGQAAGWYLSVGIMYGNDGSEGEQALREAGFSDEFVGLATYAYENNVALMNFDADGDLEPGFPIFDEDTDEIIPQDAPAPGR